MSPDGGATGPPGDWRATRDALVGGVASDLPLGTLERLFRDSQPEPTPGAPREALSKLRAGRPMDEPVASRIAFALDEARRLGFLADFVFEMSQRVSVSPRFADIARRLLEAEAETDPVRLEALSNMYEGFDEPDQIIHGMQIGRANTCLITVEGDAGTKKGTGFLVAPDLVATTFHTFLGSGCLVETPDPAGGPPRWTAAPGAAARVHATFNNSRDFAQGAPALREGRRIGAAEDWLVAASGCKGLGPDALDYVILRLEAAPPSFPQGFAPAREGFPKTETDRARIHLFQHPEGTPLRVTAGSASAIHEPTMRVGHNANSLRGASGGACTDRAFRVFAMHQGAVAEAGGDLSAALDGAVNVAVPIHAILNHAGPLPQSAAVAAETLAVATPEGRRPLIGRDATKAWVADALRPDGARLLLVDGDFGSGKTFTRRILEAMLPEEDHEVRVLRAEDGYNVMDPLALAELLLNAQPGAAGLPTQAGSGMTAAEWARGPLLDGFRRAMRARLDSAQSGRRRVFWLVLDDLDRATISETAGLRDFLDALYREAAEGDGDWLRVVLLGYRGDPGALPRSRVERERLRGVSLEAVLRWLEAFDAALGRPDDAERRRARQGAAELAMQLADATPHGMSPIGNVARMIGLTVLSYAAGGG